MKRLAVYILSFSTILLLVAGCGKNRPKHAPVDVANESDFIFDTKMNNSEDLIEMIKPIKGKAVEFDVDEEMLRPGFPWVDKKYFKLKPKWPDAGADNDKAKVIEAARARYEAELEIYKAELRKEELEAVGKAYVAFATVARKDRTQQSFDNWKQYLRRSGKEGVLLRKKLEAGAFDMASCCDVTVAGQIIAFGKEAEKDGKTLVITTGKDGGDPILSGMKGDQIKDRVDEQFMANLSAGYAMYGEDVTRRNGNADKEGLRDFIKQNYYPQISSKIADKSIILLDFTEPKMLYAALAPKLANSKGALVLMKSGSVARVNEKLVEKLIPAEGPAGMP